jgi:hypothetical protein
MYTPRQQTLSTDADTFERFATLAGLKLQVRSKDFRGGRLNTLLSGVTLDLRNAELSREGATIDLQSALSGVEILVPRDWDVVCNLEGVLAGVDSSSRPLQTGPILRVIGSVVAGAVSVR